MHMHSVRILPFSSRAAVTFVATTPSMPSQNYDASSTATLPYPPHSTTCPYPCRAWLVALPVPHHPPFLSSLPGPVPLFSDTAALRRTHGMSYGAAFCQQLCVSDGSDATVRQPRSTLGDCDAAVCCWLPSFNSRATMSYFLK